MSRQVPNPKSVLLANAEVGGYGMSVPPDGDPPAGMGVVLLYVPLELLNGKAPPDIQRDLGMPWSIEGGGGYWFDD